MLLIGNGRLITRDAANPWLENGCVAAEGGLIVQVGSTPALRERYPQSEFLDAGGGVIMPGLINVHTHIYSAFARGLSVPGYAPRGFLDILDGLWWTLDRKLTLDAVARSADATFLDCIENGVTTVFDHHAGYGAVEGSLFAIAESARRYGVRACLCYEVSDREGPDQMRAAVRENTDFIAWAGREGGDLLRGMMGLHAPFTLSDATLDYCMSRKPAQAGCHIHVAEGIDDVELSLRDHGKRPVFRLYDFGILGHRTICGHCTHVSEAEMDLLKDTGTMVAHNPESNMGNAIGCPPALRMFGKGILIGLGTDGYTNDMLESYKVGNLLHKHSLCDPAAGWTELPGMLFENNRAMAARYFETPIGILAPGARADVIVLDYDPLTPMTAENLNSHILFGMNGRCVTSTVIGGEIKMRDRVLVGADKQQVLARCRASARALWARIQEH